MPRYRANVRFGPWRPGEEFESEDDFHATLGAEGRILTVVETDSPSDTSQPVAPFETTASTVTTSSSRLIRKDESV